MNLSKKKICVISSSRSEIGILKNLIYQLNDDNFFHNKIISLDDHKISSNFSKKKDELQDFNKKNVYSIKLPKRIDTPIDIINRSSDILKKLSKIFIKEKFELIILLGDRYEILISAYTSILHKIPIAHISGGDETIGSYDNNFRHAISKFANFHFVTNKDSKRRLINMGERKNSIFNYGSLSVEKIKIIKKKNKREDFEKEFNIRFREKNFIVTYHPETNSDEIDKKFNLIIKSLFKFKKYLFIFTSPNNDHGSNKIKKIIFKNIKENKNFIYIPSFGQKKYFEILNIVDGVIGNSSSGVHEVPSFKIGTVNIGSRQDGRIRIKSVINVNYSQKKIRKAILKIISKDFKKIINKTSNPYYKKNTTKKILNKVKQILKNKINTQKKFYEQKIY